MAAAAALVVVLVVGAIALLGGDDGDDLELDVADDAVASTTATTPPTTAVDDDEVDTSATPTTAHTTTPAPTVAPTIPLPPPSTPADPWTSLTRACTNPSGWDVAYPTGWSTNTAPAPQPCVWFGPAPLDVPAAGSDALVAPVSLRLQTRDLSVPVTDVVEAERDVVVDGRPGVRRQNRTAEDLLLPAGTRFTVWEVVLATNPDGTSDVLTGIVFDRALGALSYDDAVAVLDAMMATVDLHA